MTRDEIRNILLQVLKDSLSRDSARGNTQMNTLIELVRSNIPRDTPQELHTEYHRVALEIVHEWYRSGVICFGTPDNPSAGFPFITVTQFGKKCIEDDVFLPYDPEGYILALKNIIPQIDDITTSYLAECVSTYNAEHLLSSTITMGVASENLILQLTEDLAVAIGDPTEKAKYKRSLRSNSIYKKYQSFKTQLGKYSQVIPQNITKDLDVKLDGVFNVIRLNRNSAGHPTGNQMSKKMIGLTLQVFVEYSKAIFQLRDFLQSNTL